MFFNEVNMFFKNKMNIVALYNLHTIQVGLSAFHAQFVHTLFHSPCFSAKASATCGSDYAFKGRAFSPLHPPKSQICYRISQIAYPSEPYI